MAAVGRLRMRHPGVPGPRGGGVYVPEFQRTRLLDAAFSLVAEQGSRGMTARKLCGWAGVSPKTFYDLFENCEDCFLAAFDDAVGQLAAVVLPAWEGEREWTARARAGLEALLGFLDEEPKLRKLVFVEALGAGPRVLARRAQVLEGVADAIDQGRVGVKAGRELPPLTAEGIVGAAFGVIYARLIQRDSDSESLAGLLNALMATIVLPYRGHAAAARELARLEPVHSAGSRARGGKLLAAGEHSRPIDFRLTVRTQMVLAAVAELGGRGPDPSNREVADAAGVRDQGQISRLLARLEGLGLLQNTGGVTQGVPNAWRLTPRGEEIARVALPQNTRSALLGVKR